MSGSSTQSGGGTTVGSTSQSGGGSTQTSSANGSHRHLMFRMGSNAQAISSGLVYTAAQSSIGGSRGVVLSSKDGDPPGDLYSRSRRQSFSYCKYTSSYARF